MSRNIEILPDHEALSQRAALLFLGCAEEAIRSRGTFMVALSGGETPLRMYEVIAEASRGADFWNCVHLFSCDERQVPMDDPRANWRAIREALVSRVPIPLANLHRFMGEWTDAQRAAALFEDQMEVAFRTLGRPGSPLPQFDLMVLGMGTDGHTASIFPASELFQRRGHAAAAVKVSKLNSWRMTLTPAMILNASSVLVLVSGTGKAVTLEAVLNGPFDSQRYPVQICTKRGGSTHWLLDSKAAGRLSEVE